MADTKKEHRFKSVLEAKAPAHLQAIGLVAIEITNLEHALATLLAATIDAPEDFGHIIYLTPKSAIARLDVFENIVEYLLVKKSDLANKLQGIVRKAKSVMGKRHKIVHGLWGITDELVSVYSSPKKETDKPQPYGVDDLMRIVTDIRDLVEEVADLVKDLRTYHASENSLGKPSWRAD